LTSWPGLFHTALALPAKVPSQKRDHRCGQGGTTLGTSQASPAAPPVELFHSYAHEDEALREELQGHLKILERRGLVKAWHDRKIDDAILQQLVGGVVDQVAQAQEARGQAPMDASDVEALRHEAQSLVDVPDQKRILWVDDQPQGNRHEAAALAKLQIEVVQAHSTDEAMARLREDAGPFDLVISDWERTDEPPEAGLRLFTRMRDAGLALPVVYYHGAQGGLRRQRADQVLALGAAGEAVRPGELLALVARALGGV
jgi:CheY-like chemotaxis protein